MTKPKRETISPTPINWKRANPEDLARFDPRTKYCVHNCGPHRDDPRSKTECKFLCEDCVPDTKEIGRLSVMAYATALIKSGAPLGLISKGTDYESFLAKWLQDEANQLVLLDWVKDACAGSVVAAGRQCGKTYAAARARECIAWAALYVETAQLVNGESMARRMLDECREWLLKGGAELND